MSKVDELMGNLNQKYQRTKPAPGSRADAGARVLDAIKAGEPLRVIKPFKADGEVFGAGSVFEFAEEINRSRLAQLGQLGYLVPESEYNQSHQSQLVKFARDKVADKYAVYQGARTEMGKAGARVAAAEAELGVAHEQFQGHAAQVADLEAELQEILEGPDVAELLS